MSKSSSKQRYEQLMEWIPTLKNKRKNTRKPRRQSRMDYMASKRG